MSPETIKSLGAPDRIETRSARWSSRTARRPPKPRRRSMTRSTSPARSTSTTTASAAPRRWAFGKGFESIGAEHNDVVIFSELMDSSSLFLTGNADTVYYLSGIDLTKGPMVIEQPSDGVGTINDMWFSWIIDIGGPGPDRGLGGKYLIVGPGYDGPLPEGGYFVAHSKTNRVLYAARAYLVDNDPEAGGRERQEEPEDLSLRAGRLSARASRRRSKARSHLQASRRSPRRSSSRAATCRSTRSRRATIGFFEMINENVQNEPATSYDVELAGQLAAIGIVHGKEFAPDERMKKILDRRRRRRPGDRPGAELALRRCSIRIGPITKGSQWGNMLWEGGAFFETPPPLFEDGMFKPLPPTGARTLDSRTRLLLRLHARLPGHDHAHPGRRLAVSDGLPRCRTAIPFDGAKTYKVTLPKDIPAEAFWSFTLYDNQTRSMLQTPQKYPRAGSQSYPSPAAEAAADGTTTVYFGPTQPEGVARGNWIQTDPEEGLVHDPAPLQPAAVVLRQVPGGRAKSQWWSQPARIGLSSGPSLRSKLSGEHVQPKFVGGAGRSPSPECALRTPVGRDGNR